jgi:hypothetical protein
LRRDRSGSPLSLWNLVEIGCGTDRNQQDRRLAFLEQHDPLWIVERVVVQRQEVERFLWEGRFGVAPRDLCVVTPHLSVVDFYHSGTQTRVGLPRGWIDGVDFNRVAKRKELAPDALTRLQAVNRKTQDATGRGFQGVEQGLDSEVRSRREALHGCAAVGAAGVV